MPNIKGLRLTVSEKIFKDFPVKTDKALWQGHLWPGDHNFKNLDRGPSGDDTCQILKV